MNTKLAHLDRKKRILFKREETRCQYIVFYSGSNFEAQLIHHNAQNYKVAERYHGLSVAQNTLYKKKKIQNYA